MKPQSQQSEARRPRSMTYAAGAAAAVVVLSAAAAAATSGHSAPVGAVPAPTPSPTCTGPAPQTLNGIGHHDRGPGPAVLDIDKVTTRNPFYRDTYWTGEHLQLTVMSIKRHDDIGLEMHPALDQFIRIESGTGVAKMGPTKTTLTYVKRVDKHSAVLIPAGTWHDVVNTGTTPLKLYSIYAPPNHPRNTLHKTKADGANDPLEKMKCPQDVE